MTEMAQTADHLVIIGRGRLIADTSMEALVRTSSAGWVQVRSPSTGRLAELLREHGATAETRTGGALAVHGVGVADVGELAARHGIALHELVARQASLEEAFMELTRDAVDYQPHMTSP